MGGHRPPLQSVSAFTAVRPLAEKSNRKQVSGGENIDMNESRGQAGPGPSAPASGPLGHQLARLNELFEEILPANPFQRARLGERRVCNNVAEYRDLPLLSKDELVADSAAHAPFGSNLTYPIEEYTRYHQTSGTTGPPLRVLDTDQTWNWWGRCWLDVFSAAGVTSDDRAFFAFSFAPFIGFWAAYQGASMLGAMTIPGGGADSVRRLKLIFETGATVLLCTPTYALHLAEVAEREGISSSDSPIRVTIHAGEPGASLPNTRERIAEAWGARVLDHAGASEIGAWGIGDSEGQGIYVNEAEFIGEVVGPETLEPVPEGEVGELILTNLGRGACPVVRYRTGDLVRPRRVSTKGGPARLLLEGGVIGRLDDMIPVRGVNIYPSALENIIRSVTASAEFRIVATKSGEMDEVAIEIEGSLPVSDRIKREIFDQIGIRVDVTTVEEGSLPRWELKAKRLHDLRKG